MILVGQAPGPKTDPGQPLSGASGRRLAALCGLAMPEFLALFERRNLLQEWPGKGTGKGDRFPPTSKARVLAEANQGLFLRRRVVLLGRAVAAAHDLNVPSLRFSRHWGGWFAWCPHPSGVCHWWNDPANVRVARRFWRRLSPAGGCGPGAPPRPPSS